MFPWQVGDREMPPGTLLREFLARWTAGKGHLTRFRGDSVPGGRQEVPPGTLLRGFRARWTAGSDTWNAFAGIPWQVEGGKGHLAHFRGISVAGGRREGVTWHRQNKNASKNQSKSKSKSKCQSEGRSQVRGERRSVIP